MSTQFTIFLYILNKIQSILSGLSTTVTELDQLQKQQEELQEWIKKQEQNIADWASRPLKLRPEATQKEINAMNDLLNVIGDKRAQLMTEMTGSCKYFGSLMCVLTKKKKQISFLERRNFHSGT